MESVKSKRHIPSRYITYHFVCRDCGVSDVREFDKFQNPKQDMYIFCQECSEESITGGNYDYDDDDFEPPF